MHVESSEEIMTDEVEAEEKHLSNVNFFKFPSEIQGTVILFLPLKELIRAKNLFMTLDFSKLHYKLLHSSDQKQLTFRFTKDLGRVLSKRHLNGTGIGLTEASDIVTRLANIDEHFTTLSRVLTSPHSGRACSTRDMPQQDIPNVLDGHENTFWSSDASDNQQKVDWLLFDLGTIGVISSVGVAAYKANFHYGDPIYGFQTAWLEFGFQEDDFYFKSEILIGENHNDDLQIFSSEEHFSGLKIAARYIKLWLQGCHQMQMTDRRWYFALRELRVNGIPLSEFPHSIPEILTIERDIQSKIQPWTYRPSGIQFLMTNLSTNRSGI